MSVKSAELRSGKGSGDENFPVASLLVRARHRPAILTFYEFVRVADDIADHAGLAPQEKLARLDALEATLLGRSDAEPQGVALREVLRRRGLTSRHAQDLLAAFRMDVTKLRYADWNDLMGYCALSAMPVGRFVLDVHGESHTTWLASDALCAALQIINHLQDCAADYRNLDRVYVPLDVLSAVGLGVEALKAPRAGEALLRCLRGLVDRVTLLMTESRPLPMQTQDTRLAMEISAIQALADRLIGFLKLRDPLSETVHLRKSEMLFTSGAGALRILSRRIWRIAAPSFSAARP
ncbi:MAG TPA: squalene synthase HpnC [Pseudolabrys sp.]|nr:squalene synthase HpnC [Pseudolabrys sp.]